MLSCAAVSNAYQCCPRRHTTSSGTVSTKSETLTPQDGAGTTASPYRLPFNADNDDTRQVVTVASMHPTLGSSAAVAPNPAIVAPPQAAVPGVPVGPKATAPMPATAVVTFSAPASDGGSAITGYAHVCLQRW